MNGNHVLYLLLGANLGDRLQSFLLAQNLILSRVGSIRNASLVYETAPWGVQDQPSFLNQVLMIETRLEPKEVLTAILNIEQELGRTRHERWSARTLDLDILYFNDLILKTESLTIPHPRLHERLFTLTPLAEIAPDFLHPVFQKTNQELLSACADDGAVTVFS